MPPATNSSRWSPTPDQLMILEEIYRNGLKTPNAAQIQQIASHLSLHGKIEGKNVFYWFQNHKARDRQKLRRKIYKQLQQQLAFHYSGHYNAHELQLQQQELMQRHRFVEQQFLHLQPPFSSFGLHHQQPALFQREVEEASTTENGVGQTTCRSGTLKTLELFPIRSSYLKGETAIAKDVACCSSNI